MIYLITHFQYLNFFPSIHIQLPCREQERETVIGISPWAKHEFLIHLSGNATKRCDNFLFKITRSHLSLKKNKIASAYVLGVWSVDRNDFFESERWKIFLISHIVRVKEWHNGADWWDRLFAFFSSSLLFQSTIWHYVRESIINTWTRRGVYFL